MGGARSRPSVNVKQVKDDVMGGARSRLAVNVILNLFQDLFWVSTS